MYMSFHYQLNSSSVFWVCFGASYIGPIHELACSSPSWSTKARERFQMFDRFHPRTCSLRTSRWHHKKNREKSKHHHFWTLCNPYETRTFFLFRKHPPDSLSLIVRQKHPKNPKNLAWYFWKKKRRSGSIFFSPQRTNIIRFLHACNLHL